MAKPNKAIYVIYIHPVPELVWDSEPRRFQVGLCNTLPAPNVPQGKYKVQLSFPAGERGETHSATTPAELAPGLNEVSIGPWIPGLENHVTRCAIRARPEVQVQYNDTPDPFFHVLLWPDGSDHLVMSIKCGGDFP